MHVHLRQHDHVTVQQLLSQKKLLANYLRTWVLNFKFVFRLIDENTAKNIQLNHDEALAEPNIQRRACWSNTQTDCAAPAPLPLFNLLCLISVPACFALRKKPSKSTPAHDAITSASSHMHHPNIHVSAGPSSQPMTHPRCLPRTPRHPIQNSIVAHFLAGVFYSLLI